MTHDKLLYITSLYPCQSLAKSFAPVARQRLYRQDTFQTSHIALIPIVQTHNLRNLDLMWIATEHYDGIASADLPLFKHCQIEATQAALQKAFFDVPTPKSNAQFVAGDSRLRDQQLRATDLQAIADMK